MYKIFRAILLFITISLFGSSLVQIDKEITNISIYDNDIHLYNSFSNNLHILSFKQHGNQVVINSESSIVLDNLKSSEFDYFIKDDRNSAFAFKSNSKTIAYFDNHYNFKNDYKIDISGNFNSKFLKSYKTLFFFNKSNNSFYSVENNIIKKMLEISENIYSYCINNNKIYIFFKDEIKIFSDNGGYLKAIPLTLDSKLIDILCDNQNLYLLTGSGIFKLSLQTFECSIIIHDTNIKNFAVSGNFIFYISGNSLNYIKKDL